MIAIWTTAIIVVSAVILVVLERRYPYDNGQRLLRRGFVNDLVM